MTSVPPLITVPPPPNDPVTIPLYQSVGAPSATPFGTSVLRPPTWVPPTVIPTDSCVCPAVARLGTWPSGYWS